MTITKRDETIQEEGQNKEAVTFTFTNGAKQQLEELQKHFKAPNTLELIKLAVSLLQKLKEYDDNRKPNDQGK